MSPRPKVPTVSVGQWVEHLIAEGVAARLWFVVLAALAALLALATWAHWHGRQGLDIDLFFLPVIVSCFFFRGRGAWILVVCLPLYDLPAMLGPRSTHLLERLVISSLVEVLIWSVLAFFTTVTVTRLADSRRRQILLAQDIALARTLQRALMPPYFESACVRVDARIHQTHQIGGDFYWFRPFKEKYVVLTLGDIMGKGIPASMVMAICMGFLYEWGKQSFSPAFILERLNERLCSIWPDDETWFVTLFYAIYDEESRELVYTSGGHQAALLLHADRTRPVERLKADNLPIGIFDEIVWEEKRVVLEPGDRVVVFTDGVNEARNAAGEIFTMERLEETLKGSLHLSPGEIARSVVKRVREFAGTHQLDDDLAIMVMEIKQ